jgi:hypothetical protein
VGISNVDENKDSKQGIKYNKNSQQARNEGCDYNI